MSTMARHEIHITGGPYTGNCLTILDQRRGPSNPLVIYADAGVTMNCPGETATSGPVAAIHIGNSSYVSIAGLTIAPRTLGTFANLTGVHVDGLALTDAGFGTYQPSSNILIRDMVLRDLGGDPRDGFPEDVDGIKVNQSTLVQILRNTIITPNRHGIDNVGVSGLSVCNNRLSGFRAPFPIGSNPPQIYYGIEAKGGSTDVLFEGNEVRNAPRGFALGGDSTNNDSFFPTVAPDYEGLREVARNNVIINPRESGMVFSACQQCAALGNTLWITPDATPPTRGAIFVLNSTSAPNSDLWDAGDDVVQRTLLFGDIRAVNNLFGVPDAGLQAPIVLADNLLQTGNDAGLVNTYNLWWNGEAGVPTSNGWPGPGPGEIIDRDPQIAAAGSLTTEPDLHPASTSPAVDAGTADDAMAAYDFADAARSPTQPTMGAFEPLPAPGFDSGAGDASATDASPDAHDGGCDIRRPQTCLTFHPCVFHDLFHRCCPFGVVYVNIGTAIIPVCNSPSLDAGH
jgi:hypothetical protein